MDESRAKGNSPRNEVRTTRPVELDDIDRKILALLGDEGRRPNTEIARAIGVSEPTVRKRLDRMLQQGVLRILAVLNATATGFPVDTVIGINVKTGQLRDVGKQLATINQVTYVGYVSGRFDILIEVLLRDTAELFDFLSSVLQNIDGIASSETFNVLHTEKFSYMWLPSNGTSGDLGVRGGLRQAVDGTTPKRSSRKARPG
jgi:Lrp/AsnC family transcriptional regulator for asnA, asnC and gidA